MKPRILQTQVLPSVLWFVMLFLVSRIVDQVLHSYGYSWIGKYLGIYGSVLISLSFLYSLRKKKIIEVGKIKTFLSIHEILAWAGGLMVLVHAGIHFHAVLPWLALAAMLIVILSGFTGAYLQKMAQQKITESREKLGQKGMESEKIEEILYFDSLAVDYMKKWRKVHLTITSLFTSVTLFHIISSLWFYVS